MEAIIPWLLIIVIFYFMLIRPQRKAQKEREKMLSELKKGDHVVTNAGIFGKITGIKDGIVTLEISDRVRVRVLLSQIGGLEKDVVVNRQGSGAAAEAGSK